MVETLLKIFVSKMHTVLVLVFVGSVSAYSIANTYNNNYHQIAASSNSPISHHLNPVMPNNTKKRSDVIGTSRQQNIRQSTIPMLILALVAGAFIVAFKVFLLLWKVTYYPLVDPYVTSEPVDDIVERGIDQFLVGETMKTLTRRFGISPDP